MSSRPVTLEHALHALALVIALGLRFFHLGALSLSEFEADWALQSLSIAQGLKPALGPNPAYIHLTTILFAIFQSSDFWARFWPALAGTGLVVAPWFLRTRIGRLPSLLLAFGLALDPGLNALSRLAGGPILAIAFLSLAVVLWLDNRRAAAGFFAGLALLSGVAIWFGILGLFITWGLIKLIANLQKKSSKEPDPAETRLDDKAARMRLEDFRNPLRGELGPCLWLVPCCSSPSRDWRHLLNPCWLSCAAGSPLLPSRWDGSCSPSRRMRSSRSVLGWQDLIRGVIKKEAFSMTLGLWALVALSLVVLYPNRQVADLGWTLLPVWVLAALELSRHFDFEGRQRWVMAGMAVFVFVLSILSWLQLAHINTLDLALPETRLQWLFLVAIVLVVGITIILVGTGWSPNEARLGGVWGILLPLIFFTVAMTTGAAQIREPRTLELWQPEPRLGRADLVLKVANEISNLNTGADADLPLTILGVESKALSWLFREWEVQKADILAPGATPEIVITPASMDLSLTSDYRGEALVWHELGDWKATTFSSRLNWFIYRQLPVQRENIILWVRSDLFLDSQGLPTSP